MFIVQKFNIEKRSDLTLSFLFLYLTILFFRTKKASGANQKLVEEITNPVLEAPRSGSGLRGNDIKPVKGKGSVYNIDPLTGKTPTKQTQIIIDEFPNVPKVQGFSDIIDNYAGLAEVTDVGNAKLYQIQGS